MNLEIEKSELLRGVGRSHNISERRTSMPIISNLLLEAERGVLNIVATDLEVSFRGSYPAKINTAGTFTVGARIFFDVIKRLPADDVVLEVVEGARLNVRAGSVFYSLMGVPPDDFPSIPFDKRADLVEVDAELIGEMIEKSKFAVSTDEARYNITGVFFEPVTMKEEAKGLRMVSTDGHRLALVTRAMEDVEALGLDKGSIVPRKGIRELIRLIDEEEKIKLGFVDKGLIARSKDEVLFIRLVEGDFPNYRAVIPESSENSVKIGRLVLMEVVERVKPITTERYRAMGISVSPGKVTVRASNPERGEAKETIEVEYEGPEVTMGFNPDYILDNLAAVKSDAVILEFNDGESPCTIKDEEDENFLGVVMPMRL